MVLRAYQHRDGYPEPNYEKMIPVRPQYPSASESLNFLRAATGRSPIDDMPRSLSESDSYWPEIFRRIPT